MTDGLSGSVTKGQISESIDQRRDSRRLRLENASGGARRLFLTHVRPLDGDLKVIRSKVAASGQAVCFTIGTEKTMLWTPDASLKQV